MRLLTLIVLILTACGSQHLPIVKAPIIPVLMPLSHALTVDLADGLEGQIAGVWQPLAAGTTHNSVSALRSQSGAVLSIADTGRLWLAPRSEVMLSEHEDGNVEAKVQTGKARLRTEADARDILLYPKRMVPTGAAPSEAEWTVDLGEDPEAVGIGRLETGHGDATAALALAGLQVRATRNGDLADVIVEHVFHNESDRQLEGTFRFPVPYGANVTGLAMDIDGQLMEGELVERSKARGIYDGIVDAMQDPAILEWESGNVFKLRVFPIEPKMDKRVVLRYAVPLEQTLDGWRFHYQTTAPAMKTTIGHLSVSFDGQMITDIHEAQPNQDTQVMLPKAPARAHREVRGDTIYTTVRLMPSWAPITGKSAPARRLVLVADTSRSTLEGRELMLQTIRLLLADLGPRDQFALLSGDVIQRTHFEAEAASPEAIDAAVEAIAQIEPDGASHLDALLQDAADRAQHMQGQGAQVQIVYLGDGVATWGQTDNDVIAGAAIDALDNISFSALILEKSGDDALLRQIAGATGGAVIRPHNERAVRRFALRLATTTPADRLSGVTITAEGSEVYPKSVTTLHRGDAITVTLRTDKIAPTHVTLAGIHNGKLVSETIRIADPATGGRPAQRWMVHHLAAMTAAKAETAEIVNLSQEFGVMSRHTAFLVLESEEAYAKHNIKRRQAQAQARVTGADLESDGSRLSADHIQPGDPEVWVDAPADARTVTVFFPFGDVHQAAWEPELGRWTTRFLITKETPDGVYIIRVRITHADGRVELLRLQYIVDTLKPAVEVRVRPHGWRKHRYIIEARQIVRSAELVQEGLSPDAYDRAQIVADLRRVDVRLPNGKVIQLRPTKRGIFVGHWRAGETIEAPVTLDIIAHDKALNHHATIVTLDPTEPTWSHSDE